ncbi:hypothetical protein GGS21DRAFT_490952 [Xylaria nigripes]|nr:hypothetical protein GGS21DRAFT_490952 [Xylaria nigripes]
MYIPSAQTVITAALAITGTLKDSSEIVSGKILDYALETCKDADGNKRCTPPFAVKASTCYSIQWSTAGMLTHTTAEVRDVASGEIVFYRDTDGDWTPDKNEIVRLDFRPKIPGTGNATVAYRVTTFEMKWMITVVRLFESLHGTFSILISLLVANEILLQKGPFLTHRPTSQQHTEHKLSWQTPVQQQWARTEENYASRETPR